MAEIDRLTTVFDANTSRLEAALKKIEKATYASTSRVNKTLAQTGDRFEKMFSTTVNPGKALDQIWNNSRLRLFDNGVARLGLTGSALEHLGPIGLAAGVAIGAVALALGQASKAIAFADELDDTANRLHVTTDALQEYRYALRLAGGEEKGADEALEAFSVTLGKAQAGLPRALRGFAMLGFTKAQVQTFKDVDQGLKAVTEKIAGLGSNVQKDAVINQLGLTSMKPLILEGVDAMSRLRDEAHKVGVVMDADLVKRGAKAHDEFETVVQVVKVQLMSAFVDLGPVLVGLLSWAGEFAKVISVIANKLEGIANTNMERRADALRQENTRILSGQSFVLDKKGRVDRNLKEIAQIEDHLGGPSRKTPPAAAGADLLDTSKPTGSKGPTAAEQRLKGEQALDEAQRDQLRAQQDLTQNIVEIAALKEKEIDAETEKANDRLRKDLADTKLTDTTARASIEQAIAQNKITAGLKKRAVQEELERQQAKNSLDTQGEGLATLLEIDQLQGQFLQTTEARVRLERASLLARQRHELFVETDRLNLDVAQGRKTPAERDRLLGEIRDRQGLEMKATLLPLKDEYKSAILGAFEAAKGGAKGLAEYFGDKLKASLLDTLAEDLARALAGGVAGGAGGGGGIIGAALNIGAKILGIGANANGTDNWRGGLTMVGERGKELVNIPKGGQVIPNDVLRALTNMKVQPAGSGNSSATLRMEVNVVGAIGQDGIAAIARREAQRGGAIALDAARRGSSETQRRLGRLGTP